MRKAFTLVELLIVIAIIGVLVALVLPAIQAAREAARRAQCINYQKQLAIALHHYENSRGNLPGWRDFITASPDGEIAAQASWFFCILPYIERTDLYDFLKAGEMPDAGLGVAIAQCPSHVETNTPRAITYVANGGAVDGFSTDFTIDISVANGPFLDRAAIFAAGAFAAENALARLGNPRFTLGGNILNISDMARYKNTAVRLSDISKMDGTAHTLLLSENTQRGYWIADEPYHFYHRPGGASVDIGNAYDRLPAPDNRWFALMPGPDADTRCIEGSVTFCWPRGYFQGGNPRICYPEIGGANSTYQGFTGVWNPSPEDPDTIIPISRNPYNEDRIPCFMGRYHDKKFTSWYHSARPASYHTGSVVTASFCDGNVRAISNQISELVFVQLMTCSDTQSDAGWRFPQGQRNFLQDRLFDAQTLR